MQLTLISFLTNDQKNCGICELNSENAIINIIEKDKKSDKQNCKWSNYFFLKDL